MAYQVINKILKINTQYSMLEELEEKDLPRLIEIRTKHKNSVLHKITNSIEDQKKYFRLYKNRLAAGDEVYYKIREKKTPENISGLVRITELTKNEKFSWESFILEKNTNPLIAYDVMLTIFSIGFEVYQKSICGPWDVPKEASNIILFHKNAGISEVVGEDAFYFKMQAESNSFFDRINYFRNRGIGTILKSA